MKINNIKSSKHGRTHPLATVVITALATVMGLPVNAATTSFPQNPLLTGGNSIPPNILMILDDSGSMARSWMWADKDTNSGTADSVTDRSYVNNSLYYDPRTLYLPWRTESMDLNARLSAANFKSVSNSDTSPTSSKIDLTSTSHEDKTYFYIPTVANPGTDASKYDKYRIGASSASGSGATGSYNGGAVQKLRTADGPSGKLSADKNKYSECKAISLGSAASIVVSISGDSDAYLYAYSKKDCKDDDDLLAKVESKSDPKSVTIVSPPGTIYLKIYGNGSKVNNINYSISIAVWQNALPATSLRATQEDELQNFANWYQYHRTRNKMAKAGASEAFGRLTKNYRVGFDTLWNKGGVASANTSGSTPTFPIPVGTAGGLFEGQNRADFFSKLQAAPASGATPLHGALQRAARYFGTDEPWNDSNGNPLTCRQNFAILTTDGYWNDFSGYTAVGDADKGDKKDVDGNVPQYPDSFPDTLADVAYKYWSTDIKPGSNWPNNVLTSAADPANWQHMVTFGVSIGLQGTLNPNNPPPSPWNVNPNTGGESAKRIDDLWHAALNGRGSFVVANNSDKFADALVNALATIDSRSASGSNIASSSTKTDTSTLTFVAGFSSGTWTGDLVASPFSAGLAGVSTTPDWILSQTFGAGKVNQNFKTRKVLTSKGGTAAVFDSAVAGATGFAVRTGQADEVNASNNIAYLKGDQSLELGQTGGKLRRRAHPIGDIVDSSPAYAEDTNTVYIGANDGMLHSIDAADGKVLFSYVPKGIDFGAMANLSSTSYDHRYFVDGQIDIINKSNQGNNKNILIGALGRGGRGVFALDVTDPTSMTPSNVLWDQSYSDDTTDPNMGYVLGAVRIRKGNGGKTFAFVPNGIDSPNGAAALFVYELGSGGSVINTFKLIADAGGNGLMSLGMADMNADGTVDVVYGGDLKGNVWRWDFSDSTGAVPSTSVKLFQARDSAGNAQPITGGFGVGRDPLGNVFVGFGTGRFISSNDVPGVAAQLTQTIYGIRDEGTTVAGRSDLQIRKIPFAGTGARGFEEYSSLPTGKRGWYIDLMTPERVISAPTIYGDAMFLSSVIPATGSDCQGATGSGFLNAMNLFTGTSPKSGSYFNSSGSVMDGNGKAGIVGSVGITGGMPTEVNITSILATVGTGAFSVENGGAGNTSSAAINPPSGGIPMRVSWRELVPQQ